LTFVAPRRLTAVSLGLATTLAMHVALSSSAQASCGDWLAHPDDAGAASGGADSDGPMTADHAAESRRTPAGPCHGPHCSKAPVAPLPPSTPVNFSSSGEKLGVIANVAGDEDQGSDFSVFSDADACADAGHPQRIEHPPRS
jgi:hypothetical protein